MWQNKYGHCLEPLCCGGCKCVNARIRQAEKSASGKKCVQAECNYVSISECKVMAVEALEA